MSIQTAVQQAAREAREVLAEINATATFRITQFARHPDGYFHARVSANGQTIYVYCKYGSWMAPGAQGGKPVLKEVLSPYRDVLAEKARQHAAVERRQEAADAVALAAQNAGVDASTLPAA